MKIPTKKINKILVLPDIHFPWGDWGAIKLAHKWYKKHQPELVIQLGDLTDQKIWSRWQADVDDFSPSMEFEKAEQDMKRLYKMFPEMIIVRGNHDNRIKARAIEAGIPGRMFQDVDEVFNYDGWRWMKGGERLVINTNRGPILFLHGDEMGGTPVQKSRILGHSVIQGHTHKMTLGYTRTDKAHIFGMEAGVLMDTKSKAARYAQANPVGCSLGFAVVKYGIPYFVSCEEGASV